MLNISLVETFLQCLTARTPKGINIRLWMAATMAVAALLYNIFVISPQLANLPVKIPVLFDIQGEVAQWGHRSQVYDYAMLRTVFFAVMCLAGWGLCRAMGRTLHAKRLRLLIIDIANLVVTTVVAMTQVYIEIAQGDLSQKLSEHWEYAVMSFWLLVLVIEYVTDRRKLGN